MPSPLSKAQPAAGATTQVMTGQGVLNRVMVQVSAAVACDIYDNTATAGTPIFTIPASAPAGSVYNLDIPIGTGIRVVAGAGVQLTVTYTSG